ncbi:hypothetical protein SUGI_0248060 [Cryptomeria japonica]|uniref:probable phosphatase PSR2 n=1 Tax=Cryptomeria japonica TaxID=3369 RepID=UPI00240898C7|nr:probable phosphatase PSR2 [Cryptomeria japonica]GLJ15172.1 hypothetical protein SUGI_0248060 [Cryptomeria japonica]
MDPIRFEPERRNSNGDVANAEEPLQVERRYSPSLGKDRFKEPPKQTSNVGVQNEEPGRGTSDTGVQWRQLEKKAFSAELDSVQPDELERGRSEVGLNRIENSAVEMKTSHVDFLLLDDNFKGIEPKRDNMNVLEQETSQGSQSMDIVMSEKLNSDTSKMSLEGDNMNIFEQETSRGNQHMDMAMLEKLHLESSKISLDGFKRRKHEPNPDIVRPDGCCSNNFQLSGEDDCKASNDTFQPREDKLESSSSTPDVSHDNIQSTESKESGTARDSSCTMCSKDLEKGNCIDGVDMLNHDELEQGTSNVSIHSFQSSDSEAEETSNISIDSFETSDSEGDSFKPKPSDSKVAEICTQCPYRVNYNDPNEEDSRFGLDVVFSKQPKKERSICSPYTVQPTEQKGESPKSSLPFKKEKKTIVLDLEGTLIKSSISYCTLPSYDFFVDFHDLPVSKYVLKRPGMDEFLSKLAKKYELVVFTESPRETTECILDRLDINHHITWRFYGDSCKSIDGNFVVKDLRVLGKDLGSVIIIDDNPLCYGMQPRNAVAIKSFEGKMDDRELYKLLPFFDLLHNYRDVRTAVKKNHKVVDY